LTALPQLQRAGNRHPLGPVPTVASRASALPLWSALAAVALRSLEQRPQGQTRRPPALLQAARGLGPRQFAHQNPRTSPIRRPPGQQAASCHVWYRHCGSPDAHSRSHRDHTVSRWQRRHRHPPPADQALRMRVPRTLL